MTDPDGWMPVERRGDFLRLVADRLLALDDMAFTIHSDGTMTGSIGADRLYGTWVWQGRYFCRTALIGGVDFGANRETIEVRGDEMRYARDEGRGVMHVVRMGPRQTS